MKTLFSISLLCLLTVAAPSQNLLPILKNDLWGYIDYKGEIKIRPQYLDAEKFNAGLAKVTTHDGVAYIDSLGNKLIHLGWHDDYDRIKYSEGLVAAFDSTGKFGFKNIANEWVVAPLFYEAYNFSEGLAVVWEDPDIHVDTGSGCGTELAHAHYGFIDKTGQYVISPEYGYVSDFKNGVALVNKGTGCSYINRDGTCLFNENYIGHPFKNGFARIRKNYLWGFINKTGQIVVEPKFFKIFDFNDGIAKVIIRENETKTKSGDKIFIDQKVGYIDTLGHWIIKPVFVRRRLGFVINTDFQNGYACVSYDNKKWGYIDATGKIVIAPKYENAKPFSEGLAAVKLQGKWGFINNRGEFVIKPIFNVVLESFENGVARVSEEPIGMISYPEFGYINRQGHFIWNP